ncbi:hypothetical protein MTQ01_23290 [Streptomyces sp. XM4193]|uniref:hypothetical protein n=1 Tax=Streptomyces sp. XM4193 TaxID=2929782 RepID=UPI001FFC27A1|nr:hypothetical protein [Streptomyces sp. XM4193]MCK1798896.1 hypothetical protein [Streptomyces sp. XM4193]
MAKGDYAVDLEALDNVGKKLNGVLRAMSKTKGDAKNSTHLPAGALGKGFGEEREIRIEHDRVKIILEDQILKELEDLIDDLAKKTAKTRGAYEDREYDATNAVNPEK